jgi:hypothetical protein
MVKRISKRDLPWESPGYGSIWRRLVDTTISILFKPTAAFSAMRKSGSQLPPFIYYILLGWFGAVLVSTWNALSISALRSSLDFIEQLGLPIDLGQNASAITNLSSSLMMLAITPVILAGILYLITGIQHIILMAIRGANGGFEATLRVNSYSRGATSIWLALPLLGALVRPVWWVVITIIGLAQAHGTSKTKATIAVLAPVFIAFCLCCGLYALVMALGLGSGALGTVF